MEWVKRPMSAQFLRVLTIGAIWGIFEATAGHLLHLLPIPIGFLIWYPAAFFFLATAYLATGKKTAILATATLAAAIKLLNLLLPGPIDRVINPAVSILFEGIAVFATASVCGPVRRPEKPGGILLVSIGANTLWRLLYLGYLAFLVPSWIREASVLQSGSALFRFLAVDSLLSSLLLFVCIAIIKKWLINRKPALPHTGRGITGPARVLLPFTLLALNVTLQMVL